MTDSTIWSRRRFQNGEVIVTFMIVLFLRPFTAPPPALQLRTGFQPGSICMAINHLISCGRRHIAIIGGGETYTAATDRTKGALEALAELGIEPAGPIRYGKWDEGWGRAATRLLLDQGVTFDAVVCQNDQLARGCIDVLKQQGLRIPDDVAVIGHDNWSVLTSSSRPALTSIDNETETIGRRAARYLVDAIDGNPHHGVDYVPCRLIQRESTLPLD